MVASAGTIAKRGRPRKVTASEEAGSPVPRLTASALESQLVRGDVRAWFELHGCILDKKRKKRCAPDLRCNPMQTEIGEIIRVCRERGLPCRIVTYKGRQQGSSTFSIAVAVHELRRRAAKCCIIGDEFEKSVKNLKQMFHDFVAEDKFAWGSTFTPSSGKFSHGSELVTETANDPRAGASGTMQVLICTEVAHWKETGVISAKDTFAALLNCVPEAPETLVIVESTPNGVGGVYYETFMGAVSLADYLEGRVPANWNGYFRVSYFWHQHDEYDLPVSEAEVAEIMGSLTDREQELITELALPVSRLAWRRKTLRSPKFNGDEDKFEEEYPADEVRGFLLSGRRVFPVARVQQMRREMERMKNIEPVEYGNLAWATLQGRKVKLDLCGEDEATVRLMERPRPGCRYILPVDPATGATYAMGADPDSHGAGVIRCGYVGNGGVWVPPALVARLADCYGEKRCRKKGAVCRWELTFLAEQIERLATYYGSATVVPEVNSVGMALIELLKQRPGVALYRRPVLNRTEQKFTDQYGWVTNAQTRSLVMEGLKRAVRSQGEVGGGLVVRDGAVIRELETMIVTASGREEAMGGAHDDQVMMLAIGLACQEDARVMPYPVRRGVFEMDSPRRDMSCT